MMDDIQLSNSRLEALAGCPRFFKLAYIDKLPGLSNPMGEIGSAFHNVAEDTLLHVLAEHIDGDIAFAMERAAEHSKYLPEEDAAQVRELTEYWASRFRFNPDEIGGVELELAVDWDGNPVDVGPEGLAGVMGFRGKLDLVLVYAGVTGGAITIKDWKTGWKLPSQKALESSGQLYRYAYLALQRWPHAEQITLELEYLRWRRQYKVPLDMQKLRDETWPNILSVKADIEERITTGKGWEPTPGAQCDFCSYDCPTRGTPAEAVVPASRDDAVRLAGEIVAFESAAALRRMYLKNWIEAFGGRLEAAGLYWSVESTENEVWPWSRVHATAKALGLDPDALLREPTDAQLAKYVDKNKELQNALAEGGVKAAIKFGDPRFDGRKNKPSSWEPPQS